MDKIDIKKNDIKKNLGYLALLIGLVHNKDISQYFTDCSYKCIPTDLNDINDLLVLNG